MRKVKKLTFACIGESPLNRNDPKSEKYSLDLLKRVISNFQIVWRHRSESGFVPVKGTLPYSPLKSLIFSIFDFDFDSSVFEILIL
jgi:hypothetical protein